MAHGKWMWMIAAGVMLTAAFSRGDSFMEELTHHHADNDGVKIHYVSVGEGPVLLFVHGFPDFWYSWRKQIAALKDDFQCVAMDQRGYNLSDAPEGQENYDGEILATDVAAVVKDLGVERVTLVGHDWGGFVAWMTAMYHPEIVERLVVCNLPHPKGLSRELANNPEQQQNSAYAQAFRQPEAHKVLNIPFLAGAASQGDSDAHARYVEAFERSNLEAMLHYYRQNYPAEPYVEDPRAFPLVKAPTLIFHGLDDKALHANGLNGTWNWVDAPLTIVTVPGAGHWVHLDAPELVNGTLRDWVSRN